MYELLNKIFDITIVSIAILGPTLGPLLYFGNEAIKDMNLDLEERKLGRRS